MGSARQKREYFKRASGAIVLDNVEVLFCASENGRNYFALGAVPFGGFTVIEYIRYKCACVRTVPSSAQIEELGLNPYRLIGGLSPAEMRVAMYLAETGGSTDKAVVINLDGAKYTRKNAAALSKLLSRIGEAYVCVTDKRFLRKATGYKTLQFGKPPAKKKRPAFYAAKLLAKKLGATKVAVM